MRFFATHFTGVYHIGTYAPFISCGDYKKPDIIIRIGTILVIVEVDEHYHRDYPQTCEWSKCMQHTQSALETDNVRNVIFIRFNPNGWQVRGETVVTPLETKMKVLKEHLDKQLTKVEEHQLQVSYLYYPTEVEDPIDIKSQEELEHWYGVLTFDIVTDISRSSDDTEEVSSSIPFAELATD